MAYAKILQTQFTEEREKVYVWEMCFVLPSKKMVPSYSTVAWRGPVDQALKYLTTIAPQKKKHTKKVRGKMFPAVTSRGCHHSTKYRCTMSGGCLLMAKSIQSNNRSQWYMEQ